MKKKELRCLISESLFIRYKAFCIAKKLSIPKQIKDLIRKFMEVMETNKDYIRIGK